MLATFQAEYFPIFFLKIWGFRHQNYLPDTENPNTMLTTAVPRQLTYYRWLSLYPSSYWSFPICKTSSSHEPLLSQNHLSRIQIPKIDVNTVSCPLSLGTLSKLWINWDTEQALRRKTMSSVAEVQHYLARPSQGQHPLLCQVHNLNKLGKS